MEVGLGEAFPVGWGNTKPGNHLLSELKCLLEELGTRSHENMNILLAIFHTIPIQLKLWLLALDFLPPLGFSSLELLPSRSLM